MQRATAEEEGTAADAADQEEALVRIEVDGGCGASIRDEIVA